jgi:hypothetical protein
MPPGRGVLEGGNMKEPSRRIAGIVLITIPTVMLGGASLLAALLERQPGYVDNPLRQDLWRAGHAHAGVYLVLALVMLRYADEAALSAVWRWVARLGVPVAAILIPAAFFLSVVSPTATEPGPAIYLAVPGAIALAASVLTLGVGLVRAR